MRSINISLVGLVLVVSACTSAEPADTESLSVPEVTTEASADIGTAPATTPEIVSGGVTLTASTYSLVAGETVTMQSAGLDGEVAWEAAAGTIESDSDRAQFTPPGRLGDYVVTARSGTASATTTVSVDRATIYENDFSVEPGPEWDKLLLAESPSGESFLGEFGAERTRLRLQGLPTHDEVTIEFDLYVLRSWDGLAGKDSWQMRINDQQVITTTFSNDEKRQAWPDNFPYGDNPGRSGATATDSLGYWFGQEDNPADAKYHIERSFGHEGPLLWVDFQGYELQGVADESWGLDNVVVTIHRTPRLSERPATELTVAVQPGQVTVSGNVPDPTIETIVRKGAENWFEASTLNVDLSPLEDAITPVWLPRLADILYEMRDVREVTLSVTDNVAVLDGKISTERFRTTLIEQLSRRFGYTVVIIDHTENAVAPEVVDEIESLVGMFAVGSAELDEDAKSVLDKVVSLLSDSPEMAIHVVGHTDLTGTEKDNSDLSWERARTAIAYMVSRGVSEERLNTHADGSSKPVAEGTSAEANAANRRVVFWVVDR